MSTSIASTSPSAQFTTDQQQLIRDTVAKGATPDEMKLFLYRCQIMKLDPLKPGMIHFVKYGSAPGVMVVGIDGFRSIASRTGQMSGIKRGVNLDAKGNLISAWAEVYRKDWAAPAREEVPFAEYNTGKGPWAKMPQTMLKKVAECAALRMAFPDDLGGVYERAEMDQAADALPEVRPPQPEPGDGFVRDGYRVTGLPKEFERYNAKLIQDIPAAVHRDIVSRIESNAATTGKPITRKWLEYVALAEPIIAAWENSQIEPIDAEPSFDDEEPAPIPSPGIIVK